MKRSTINTASGPEEKIEYLKLKLAGIFLFSGIPLEQLDELIDQYWEKFDCLDFVSAKNRASATRQVRSVCSLPVNDEVIFVTQGELLIFSEVVSDKAKEKSSATLIEVLKPGEHFGDWFYRSETSITGELNIRAETRNKETQWVSIHLPDFDEAVNLLNQTLFLENAYEKKSDSYSDLVYRLQQMKEANVYQKLRLFIQKYSSDNCFDFTHFSQQTIADAIGCDRTAITKELKALQSLPAQALGINLQQKILTFQIMPELAPSIPAYSRFRWFVEKKCLLIESNQKHLWARHQFAPGSFGLRFDQEMLKSLLETTGIDESELEQLLSALSAQDGKFPVRKRSKNLDDEEDEPFRVHSAKVNGTWQLIYKNTLPEIITSK